MKRALVIGNSGGIGSALAAGLFEIGYDVQGLSRSQHQLDVRNKASIERAFKLVTAPFDVIFIATGVLAARGGAPEKSLATIDAEAMAEVFATNAIGPALVLQSLGKLLSRDVPPRIGVLSARVGSIGDNRLGGWHSYRASKAALNQLVRGAAIELSRTHKGSVCVAMHPGTVETEFTSKFIGRHEMQMPDSAAKKLISVLLGLPPEETGEFFDHNGKRVVW